MRSLRLWLRHHRLRSRRRRLWELAADDCPNSASEISTDHPDVTNSSRAVSHGSMQTERCRLDRRQGSNVVSGSETRLASRRRAMHRSIGRRADVFSLFQRPRSSGFSDFVVSIKRELPVPLGSDLSATGGLGFSTDASKISSQGYDPYVQFQWSRLLNDDWSLHCIRRHTRDRSAHHFVIN